MTERATGKKTTFFKGDLAVYTGKEVDLYGGHFYEIEMVEGLDAGNLKVVKKAPRKELFFITDSE